MLPKFPEANSIDQFWPIAVWDFLHKTILKLLSDRLALVAGHILITSHFSFIRGKNIHDSIFTASDCVNLLNRKSFRGNRVLKIDIKRLL